MPWVSPFLCPFIHPHLQNHPNGLLPGWLCQQQGFSLVFPLNHGAPLAFGVVAIPICFPSSRMGLPRSAAGHGQPHGVWCLLLPIDKYQPAEVLEADIELVAPADLPPIRSTDIICGRRGEAASAPWYPHPASHPPLQPPRSRVG